MYLYTLVLLRYLLRKTFWSNSTHEFSLNSDDKTMEREKSVLLIIIEYFIPLLSEERQPFLKHPFHVNNNCYSTFCLTICWLYNCFQNINWKYPANVFIFPWLNVLRVVWPWQCIFDKLQPLDGITTIGKTCKLHIYL